METENSNYIYLPLLGIFASILALLILSEQGKPADIIPYGLVFIISVVDVFRETSKEVNDDQYFNSGNANTNRYSGSNNHYCNYNRNTYDNSRYTPANREKELIKNETKKIRQILNKTKSVKLHKEELSNKK